jgi:hypothetical protein
MEVNTILKKQEGWFIVFRIDRKNFLWIFACMQLNLRMHFLRRYPEKIKPFYDVIRERG